MSRRLQLGVPELFLQQKERYLCVGHIQAAQDMDEWVEGRIFPGSLLTVRAPAAFFDPLTGCLITEPVQLTNSLMPQPRTFDRKTLQQWWINCAGALPRLC